MASEIQSVDDNMNAAPIIIITLNRYEHFVRCIESLKSNKLSAFTELYVGVDYPPNESYVDGYNKILKYLNSLTGFKEIHVFKNEKNLGSEKNFYYIQNIVFERFDRYIFVEDDCEASGNFLEFMNVALRKYENDPDVLAVSGYAYPICSNEFIDNNRVIKINTYFAGNAFGWWKNKENHMNAYLNVEKFEKYYLNEETIKRLRASSKNQYCNFVKGMIGYTSELISNNGLAKIDISYGLYMFFEHKTMIFPVISKIRNWGYDGTGEHCNTTDGKPTEFRGYAFSSQPIDESGTVGKLIEYNKSDINSDLEKYFRVKNTELFKTDVAYHISRLIGLNNMRIIVKKLV